jgi:hypothetical protein
LTRHGGISYGEQVRRSRGVRTEGNRAVTATSFAELVNHAMEREGLTSDYQLSSAIGLLPGKKPFNARQVNRLREGKRKSLPPVLVARIIEVLHFTPEEAEQAWDFALKERGLSRDDLTDEGFERFRGEAFAVQAGALKGTWTFVPASWRWALGMGRTGLGAAA